MWCSTCRASSNTRTGQQKPRLLATATRVTADDATARMPHEEVTAWTDGSEPDHDYADDDRPLSKAERKRLRKQQGRYRAA